MRDRFARQVDYVRAASGACEEQIRELFAEGMLASVAAAIDAAAVGAPWVRSLSSRARRDSPWVHPPATPAITPGTQAPPARSFRPTILPSYPVVQEDGSRQHETTT